MTVRPAGWSQRQIGDDCTVGDGAHASIKRQDTGILYLTSRNFKDGRLDLARVDCISEEDFAKHFRGASKALTKPETDDLVFSIIGTIGEPYLVRPQDRFGISSSVAILRPDRAVLSPSYLYYWVRGHVFQDALYGIKGGVAQGYVSLEMIRSLPLDYPPLPTQRKIAAILSAYDDLIENNTRRIAILEEMAQLLYREWFVHFRFPGHESVPMVDSELGPIPEGWRIVTLSEIADINASSISKEDAPERINYVTISSVSPGRIEAMEPMAFENAPGRARRIVQHGDIIWSTVRPNRRSYCLILDPVPNLIVSTGFAVITPQKVPYTYLYHALTTDEFVAYLINNATGAAYPAVNTGDFQDADILLPPTGLLQSFHDIVLDFYDERQNLHNRSGVLRHTRDLLLPRLISGRLDVSRLAIDGGEEDYHG